MQGSPAGTGEPVDCAVSGIGSDPEGGAGMTLTQEERAAIRVLAEYYGACIGDCDVCDFGTKHIPECLPRSADLARKRLRI